MNRTYRIIITLVVLVLAGALVQWASAPLFFGSELARSAIPENVTISGRTFHVEGFNVTESGTVIHGWSAVQALRLAYAKMLVERTPLLGLEGTNTDRLRLNTAWLKQVTEQLSEHQASSTDARYVREALYPFTYLDALTTLEESRQRFIASGSDQDYDVYRNHLRGAIAAGIRDATTLSNAFNIETKPFRAVRLPGFGGTLTVWSGQHAIDSIVPALSSVAYQMHMRDWCLHGLILACPRYPRFEPRQPTDAVAPRPFKADTAAARILRKAAATTTYDYLYEPVELLRSVCLNTLSAPYDVETSAQLTTNFDLLHYLDELYFTDAKAGNGSVPNYLRASYGLGYLIINPFTFYICPEMGRDVSDAQAIRHTVQLAHAYGDDNPARAALLMVGPSTADATAYLRSPVATTSEAYLRAVASAQLMFLQKSAGLDAVVGQIAHINENDLTAFARGAPYDLSAATLFLTHTAAPSLFLSFQINATSPMLPLTAEDQGALARQYIPLSRLLEQHTDAFVIEQLHGLSHAEIGRYDQ